MNIIVKDIITKQKGKTDGMISVSYGQYIKLFKDLDMSVYSTEELEKYANDLKTEIGLEITQAEEALNKALKKAEAWVLENKPRATNHGLKVKTFRHGAVKLPGNGNDKWWVPVQVTGWNEDWETRYAATPLTGRIYYHKNKKNEVKIWLQSIPKAQRDLHSKFTLDNFEEVIKKTFTEEYFESIPAASHDFKWVHDSEITYGVIAPVVKAHDIYTACNYYSYSYNRDQKADNLLRCLRSATPIEAFVQSTDMLMNPNSKPAIKLTLYGKNKWNTNRTFVFTDDKVYVSHYNGVELWPINAKITQGPYSQIKAEPSYMGSCLLKVEDQDLIDKNEFFGHFIAKVGK